MNIEVRFVTWQPLRFCGSILYLDPKTTIGELLALHGDHGHELLCNGSEVAGGGPPAVSVSVARAGEPGELGPHHTDRDKNATAQGDAADRGDDHVGPSLVEGGGDARPEVLDPVGHPELKWNLGEADRLERNAHRATGRQHIEGDPDRPIALPQAEDAVDKEIEASRKLDRHQVDVGTDQGGATVIGVGRDVLCDQDRAQDRHLHLMRLLAIGHCVPPVGLDASTFVRSGGYLNADLFFSDRWWKAARKAISDEAVRDMKP